MSVTCHSLARTFSACESPVLFGEMEHRSASRTERRAVTGRQGPRTTDEHIMERLERRWVLGVLEQGQGSLHSTRDGRGSSATVNLRALGCAAHSPVRGQDGTPKGVHHGWVQKIAVDPHGTVFQHVVQSVHIDHPRLPVTVVVTCVLHR